MYRIYGLWAFIGLIAYAAIFMSLCLQYIAGYLGHSQTAVTPSWVVLAVQGFFGLILLSPVWRRLWKLLPSLNQWIFPDLSGEWEFAVESNWSRLVYLCDAADGKQAAFDIRTVDESSLPPLLTTPTMKAVIKQSWLSIDMEVTNPNSNSPIQQSHTVFIEPKRGIGSERHSIFYVFRQENKMASITDERSFYGAARLTWNPEKGILEGIMWTHRSWERGINTAAHVTMTRVK